MLYFQGVKMSSWSYHLSGHYQTPRLITNPPGDGYARTWALSLTNIRWMLRWLERNKDCVLLVSGIRKNLLFKELGLRNMCGQYDVARNGFALLIKTNENVQLIEVFVKFSNHRPWRSNVIVRTSCLLPSFPCSCSFRESCKSI